VVYIPLPTALKKEWVLKAAERKKHILCEKPIARNIEDAVEMVEACKRNGVQFMDNVMFRHHARLGSMEKAIDDKDAFGATKHVVSAFSIPCGNEEDWLKGNIRTKAETEPLGCLGDLGIYSIAFSLWAFDYEDPESVSCLYLEKTDEGVPLTAHGVMRFARGRFATFDCSFMEVLRQWAEVVGEKQGLRLDDFVVNNDKHKASFDTFTGSIPPGAITFDKSATTSTAESVQHTKLIEKMTSLVTGETDDGWPTVSLQVHKILIACHTSGMNDGAWQPIQKSFEPCSLKRKAPPQLNMASLS